MHPYGSEESFVIPCSFRGSGIKNLLFQKNKKNTNKKKPTQKTPTTTKNQILHCSIVASWVMAFREIPFAIKSELFSLAFCEAAEVGDPCQAHEMIPNADGEL